jgi:hypothetical protein
MEAPMKAWRRAFIQVSFLIVLLFAAQAVGTARAGFILGRGKEIRVTCDAPQQTEPPTMTPEERALRAFPGFQPGGEISGLFPGRLMSRGFTDWPPMRYIGDSAEIAGKTFTVREVILVPGSNHPMAYEPATGRKRQAPQGLRTNLFDFSKNTEVFIPSNSTLVMVKVDVEPEAIEPLPGFAGCETADERDYAIILRISYTGLGETQVILTDRDENFGSYRSPRIYCLTSGWLYFHIGTLSVDQSQLWLEIIDGEFDRDLAIWTLTSTQ